jgi:hypothetical protein
VYVNADGTMRWMVSNFVLVRAVRIDYRVYLALGWTVEVTGHSTRFTNDRTGHGMIVSVDDRVETSS